MSFKLIYSYTYNKLLSKKLLFLKFSFKIIKLFNKSLYF